MLIPGSKEMYGKPGSDSEYLKIIGKNLTNETP